MLRMRFPCVELELSLACPDNQIHSVLNRDCHEPYVLHHRARAICVTSQSTSHMCYMTEREYVEVLGYLACRVFCQEERTQLRNREKQRLELSSQRQSQIGSGSRSEKIKTYNYKDSRVSDHRLKNNYALEGVLEGDLEQNIQEMITLDQSEQLEAMAEKQAVAA
jgi:hypothetical protein